MPAAAGITESAYVHPGQFSSGFHTACLISAALCVLGGLLAAVMIRNPHPSAEAAPVAAPPGRADHFCGVEAPPPGSRRIAASDSDRQSPG